MTARTRTAPTPEPYRPPERPGLAGLLIGEALRQARLVLGPLLDAHAAGWTDLPADLLEQVRAAHRLAHAHRTSPSPLTPAQAEQQLAGDLVEAAVAGTALPDAAPLVAAATAADAAATYRRALSEAHERVLRGATFAALDRAEQLTVDYLRPAHTATLEQARQVCAAYRRHGHDATALLASGDLDAQRAYMDAEQVAGRYRALVKANLALTNATGRVALDVGEHFAEMRDLARLRPSGTDAPWPAAERDRLAWLLEHDAQLWCPTAAERDAAWRAHHDPQAQAEARSQQRDPGAELVVG